MIDKKALEGICENLIKYDPNIVEIIKFGSSVYAPESAKDVDLLIFTKDKKPYEGYFDTAYEIDATFDIDVLVFQLDEKIREELLRGVIGAHEVLHGSGETLLRLAKTLGDPTFDDAKSSIKVSKGLMELYKVEEDPTTKDRLVREAFDGLFHAARLASMAYLSTEVARWGAIKAQLPHPHKVALDNFIKTLHIKYFYNGEYPRDKIEGEFKRWLKLIEEYVDELESDMRMQKGHTLSHRSPQSHL